MSEVMMGTRSCSIDTPSTTKLSVLVATLYKIEVKTIEPSVSDHILIWRTGFTPGGLYMYLYTNLGRTVFLLVNTF